MGEMGLDTMRLIMRRFIALWLQRPQPGDHDHSDDVNQYG